MDNKEKIDDCTEQLVEQSPRDLGYDINGNIGVFLKDLNVECKKCSSGRISVEWVCLSCDNSNV